MTGSEAATPAGTDHGPTALPKREARIAAILCILAAVRVFAFSAAFPFFNNVDEQSHFDLVCKYSHGHIPSGLERRDEESSRLIALYFSPEYLLTPDAYPGGVIPPPPWPMPEEARPLLEQRVAASMQVMNFESTQPPLYYLVTGAWYRIGRWIGVSGGHALYWTRLLNVFAVAALTWLAYVFARTCFPHRPFLRLGVPLLIAFFPTDIFYAVNNDVFLPLANGAAMLGLLRIYKGERPSAAFHAGTGLLIAAAILVKYTSIAIVPVGAALIVLTVMRQPTVGERKRAIVNGAVLFAAAALPVGLWCLRNALLFGDVTGSMSKVSYLGWTLKPLAAMFDHPIFTFAGLALYWRQTLALFWRGEFVWYLQPIASRGWDWFYGISSLVLPAVAVIAAGTWRKRDEPDARPVLWSSLAFFLFSLAFLATVSVMYDFGACFYPSRERPFVVSGRLMLGALIPFAALYVYGLDALLPARLNTRARFAVLIVGIAWLTLTEIGLSRVAFESGYNWFHMI